MKLLMCHGLRGRKAHHRQKLCEELRAEMPPGMPEEILRRRREPTDWRAFQIRMELIGDNEGLRHFPALLDDPEWVAAVQQHCRHHCDVEFPEGGRQIVNISVVADVFYIYWVGKNRVVAMF